MNGHEYARQVSSRLRVIRELEGLSLLDIEQKSRGRFKASKIGTYERGDRNMTAEKLADYAKWLGVPLLALLPGEGDQAFVDYVATGHARNLARTIEALGVRLPAA